LPAPARQQLQKLLPRHRAVPVLVGDLDHISQVVLSEVLAQFVGDPAQVADGDEAGAFGVEEGEDVVDVLCGVALDQSWREEVDELLEGDVSGAFRVEVEDQLVDGFVAGLGAEGGECVAEFCVGEEVPLGLMEPAWSLSKMSKMSLISRMSVSLRPARWYGRVSNFGFTACCGDCLVALLMRRSNYYH
jgi:hypothetical protein